MKRRIKSAIVLGAVSAVAASCTQNPKPPEVTFADLAFRAAEVTSVGQQEYLLGPSGQTCVDCFDEPYTVSFSFRATYGAPGSAAVEWTTTRATNPANATVKVCADTHQVDQGGLCADGSDTVALTEGAGGTGGQIDFEDVSEPGSMQYFTGTDAEMIGAWEWVVEQDALTETELFDVVAAALKNVLDATVSDAAIPATAEELATLTAEGLQAELANAEFNTAGLGLFADDLVDSNLYIFIGAKGALAASLDAAYPEPEPVIIGLEAEGIPDISNMYIKSTNARDFLDERFVEMNPEAAGFGIDLNYDFKITG